MTLMVPLKRKRLKPLSDKCFSPSDVIRLGLEPRAHTLKVYCSTN